MSGARPNQAFKPTLLKSQQRGRDAGMGTIASVSLDKAWGGLHYLLTGSGDLNVDSQEPEYFLLGGVLFPDVSEHVAVHTSDQVAAFAAFLVASPTNQLMQRFNPLHMNELNVYGKPWSQEAEQYLAVHLAKLSEFVITAATRGSGMLVVIC